MCQSHSWTPDKVNSLSHAGDLYIRAVKPLEKNDGQNSDTSNESKSQVRGTACTPVCVLACVYMCGYICILWISAH